VDGVRFPQLRLGLFEELVCQCEVSLGQGVTCCEGQCAGVPSQDDDLHGGIYESAGVVHIVCH